MSRFFERLGENPVQFVFGKRLHSELDQAVSLALSPEVRIFIHGVEYCRYDCSQSFEKLIVELKKWAPSKSPKLKLTIRLSVAMNAARRHGVNVRWQVRNALEHVLENAELGVEEWEKKTNSTGLV